MERIGNDFKYYVDGTQQGAITTDSTAFANFADVLAVGAWEYSGGSPLNGSLDEFRISKGIARYSGSFTPPQKQFGRPDLKIKDVSGTYTIRLKQIN